MIAWTVMITDNWFFSSTITSTWRESDIDWRAMAHYSSLCISSLASAKWGPCHRLTKKESSRNSFAPSLAIGEKPTSFSTSVMPNSGYAFQITSRLSVLKTSRPCSTSTLPGLFGSTATLSASMGPGKERTSMSSLRSCTFATLLSCKSLTRTFCSTATWLSYLPLNRQVMSLKIANTASTNSYPSSC